MKADVLAQIVADILMDTAKVRWKQPTHERNLNAAIREIIDLRPDAYTKVRNLNLTAGTEQALAAGGLYLSKVICNMGLTGAAPGISPRRIDLETMNATRPNWRSDTASAIVRNYVFDPKTPKRFEVWPPQPNPGGYIRILQTEYPTEVQLGKGVDFPLDDKFINAAIQLSLYWGWQKAVGGDLNRSAYHRKEALQLLGVSGMAQQAQAKG